MNFDLWVISDGASMREALAKIDSNHHGIVFAVDANNAVIGLATDGDVRRRLLAGGSLDDPLASCTNTQFISATPSTPREVLLKRLDSEIRVIPILDPSHRLVDIVTHNSLPVSEEGATYSRSRAPVRVSFGGGGSDLTEYFQTERGAVISSTISIYSHATLRKRADQKISIHSTDLGSSLEADGLSEALTQEGPFSLIQALLKAIRPNFGFDLHLSSDFPMNSGLGGSSVVAATILGCFNQFREDKWDRYEISELAYQAERIHMKVLGGWQDQYATVFGGFNFMEFTMEGNRVFPLRIASDVLLELEESLVLCDTNFSHSSHEVHKDQQQRMADGEIREHMRTNVALTDQIRDHLLRGRLVDIGNALDQGWQLKRKFSPRISNSEIDRVYESAKKHGAVGGKLLGAGGGGFFLFYSLPFHRSELLDHLESAGNKVRTFRFDEEGLQSWSVRESLNMVGLT